MKNDNDAVILFARVLNLRDGKFPDEEVVAVLSEGIGGTKDGKNEVETIHEIISTHNLRDLFLGAALYAAMLDNSESKIIEQMVAKMDETKL